MEVDAELLRFRAATGDEIQTEVCLPEGEDGGHELWCRQALVFRCCVLHESGDQPEVYAREAYEKVECGKDGRNIVCVTA